MRVRKITLPQPEYDKLVAGLTAQAFEELARASIESGEPHHVFHAASHDGFSAGASVWAPTEEALVEPGEWEGVEIRPEPEQ